MELPKVRRYRKGGMDRLYVEDQEGRALGWAETVSGEITIQIPGSEARVAAALEGWASLYPEDDIATHPPARHVAGLAGAWQAEIDDLADYIVNLKGQADAARYQRDRYLRGASGEQRIGVELNRLHKDGWGILHSIPLYDARADLDHLLIGPGGVWTINSKALDAKTIRVDGDRMVVGRVRVDYIPAARAEAETVTRYLRAAGCSREVRAAIVLDVPRSTVVDARERPEGVTLVLLSQAVAWFRKQPRTLSDLEIAETFAVARRRQTWGD